MLEADFVPSPVVFRCGGVIAIPHFFGWGGHEHTDLEHVFCMSAYCSDKSTIWRPLIEVKQVRRVLSEEAEGYPWMKISNHCGYDGDGRTPIVTGTDSASEVDIYPEGMVGEGEGEECGEVLVGGAVGGLVLAFALVRVCA